MTFSLTALADWPEFRGPYENGQAATRKDGGSLGLPLHWSETENVRWKTPIHFRGWSTPVVLGEQIWLTTATLDGHDFFVLCLDAQTGQIQLDQALFHCDNPEPLGNNVNCYATPSAVIEPGRVYLHFGSYGTACIDTKTFKILWQRQDLPCRHYRGPSSSPILFENLLILTMDGADQQYVVALEKDTGRTIWKTARSVEWNDENVPGKMAREGDLRKAHSTPLLAKVGETTQLLSTGAKAGYGYDPRTGRELWRVRYPAWSSAPRPVYEKGLAFFITGLGKTELWAVRSSGQGDVTETNVVWKFDSLVAKTASPIVFEGLLYMVSDDGAVTCLDSTTGKRVWQERIGGTYAASPIFGDGRLYFCSQQGNTIVLKAGRSFQTLATNKLADGFMASPAVDGKALFLRTKTHLYRIESD